MRTLKIQLFFCLSLLTLAFICPQNLSAQGATGQNPRFTFWRTVNGDFVGAPVGSLFYRSLIAGEYYVGASMKVMSSGPGVNGFMPMDFIFETGTDTLTERLRINSIGLVGINIKNPGARLHVDQRYNSTKPEGPLLKVSGGAGNEIADFTIEHLPADSSLLLASLRGDMSISSGDLLVEDEDVEVQKGKVIVREDNVEVQKGKVIVRQDNVEIDEGKLLVRRDNVEIARGKLLVNTTEEEGNHTALFNGSIIATEAWIKEFPDWPDYVFEKGYDLMSLEETARYIDTNGHLPGVPSAREIDKEGLRLGEMQTILLKKIEELTLQVILLNEGHKQELARKDEELSKVTKRIAELEQK